MMKTNKKKRLVSQVRAHSLAVCCRETALRLAILTALYPTFAHANPNGAQIVSGQVSIDTATPGVTTVTNSPNAIINWQNFSIAQNEITRFIQQNSQSAVLNRIIGQNPSEILGQLASNGKVFLINPNGIVFGAGAVVDTQGLIASSLNLSDRDFQNGNYHFMAGSSAGNIVNEGIIRAGKDGNIVLIAPQIENNGIINSDGGAITLAAGQELTITNLDDPDIRFQIQAPENSVINLGKLLAEGGAVNVFANTIKHSGEINADSVEVDAQGNIRLVAKQDITLETGSKVSANSSQGDAGAIHVESKTGTTLAQGAIEAQASQSKGGDIKLLGEQVGVLDQAKIDASGQNGGGQVLVGGDYQGKNPDVHDAKATYVGKDTTINADAKAHGDGGKVIVWSDNATRAYGDISAQGGSSRGNGGFIETSGHWLDTADIKINASSPNGQKGNWLLDPTNIYIAANQANATTAGMTGTDIAANSSGPSIFQAVSTADSLLQTSTLVTALGNNDVTVTTASSGSSAPGNITVVDSIDNVATAERTLYLKAENAIIINSSVGIRSSNNKLNVILNADADGSNAGNIQMNVGSSISSNGGNIIMGGGNCGTTGCSPLSSNTTGAAMGFANTVSQREGIYLNAPGGELNLNSGGGLIWLKGQGLAGTGAAYGIYTHAAILNTYAGDIVLNGTGGDGTNNNIGVELNGGSGTHFYTTTGNIDITGTGQGSGASNYGVYTTFTELKSSNGGSITLTGSGSSNGTYNNAGVHFDSDLGKNSFTTTSGGLNIVGHGGGTTNDNYGIFATFTELNTGSGTINITGYGSNGTDSNYGVLLDSGSEINTFTTTTGTLNILGQGNGSGSNNRGIESYSNTFSSNTGTITLNGSVTGTGTGIGLSLDSNLLTTDGEITITGAGQGTNTGNTAGLRFINSQIINSGNLSISATGTGSAGDLIQTGGLISNRGANGTATGSYDVTLTGNDLTLNSVRSQDNIILNASGNLIINTPADYIDDQYFTYILPFTFTFFGTNYTQAYISSNGLISFNAGISEYSDSLGLAYLNSQVIAPAWNDWELHTVSGKNIFISQPTANDLAVKWDVERYWNQTDKTATFEAVLNSNGNIKFNYGAATYSFVNDVTIGLSNGASTITSGLMTGFTSLNNLKSTTFTWNSGTSTYDETISTSNDALVSSTPIYKDRVEFTYSNDPSIPALSTLADMTINSSGTITNSASISATNISLNADKMVLAGGTLSGSSSVSLATKTNGVAIALGEDGVDRSIDTLASTLELNTNELNTITTPILRIGNSNSGALTINSALANSLSTDALKNVSSALSLTSGGAITQLAAHGLYSAGTIAALPGLYVSGASVNLTQANPEGVIAGSTTGGDFKYHSSNLLTVSTVDGHSGLNVAGNILLESDSSSGISQSSPIIATAPGNNGTGALVLKTIGPVELANTSNSMNWLSADLNLSGYGTGAFYVYNSSDLNVGGGFFGIDGISTNNTSIGIATGSGSQLSVTTPIAAGTASVGLWSGTGGTSQSGTGTITAQSLGIKSTGTVTLGGLSNSITNLAVETEGGNVTFENNKTFNVASFTGGTTPHTYSMTGIDTCPTSGSCGDVTLYATDNNTGTAEDVNIPSQINAGTTGTVSLYANNGGTVYGSGTSPDIIAGRLYITASNNIYGAGGLHTNVPLLNTLSAANGFIDILSFSSTLGIQNISAATTIGITAYSPITVNSTGITSSTGSINLTASDGYGYGLTVNAPLASSGNITLTASSAGGTEISPSLSSSGSGTLLTNTKSFTFTKVLSSTEVAANNAAAQAAADAAAAEAAAQAAAEAAAAEAAAQAAAEAAAAEAAAQAAAEAAAAEAAAQAAAEAAAAEAAAQAAAEAAAAEAAAQAAAAKAAADAAAAVPDLLDGGAPTPVEVTLTNSLEQVTAVVVATTAQSGPSLVPALGDSDNPGSSTTSNTTGGSAEPSAVKGKTGKQCTK